MTIAWDKAKDEVLRENTAQAIQEQLEHLNNQAEKYQRRWIWELFQNALDAAPARQGIALRLRLDGNFEFSHNGVPFATKEILHLIFHGSTKREKEESIGRYGTGFLTTHLISRKVRVRGSLETDQAFDFVLDRSGATPNDLAAAMELSERRLRESVAQNLKPDGRWTTFEYDLSVGSQSVVQNTLRDIRNIASMVLVFNPRIENLQIEDGVQCSFSVRRESVTAEISLVTVDITEREKCSRRFAVTETEDVTVMVPLQDDPNGLAIGEVNGLPRLFVAFPLVGTETLPLPFVVNCPNAKPTEERNGLYLNTEDTADNLRNKALLEKAWDVYARVADWAAHSGLQKLQRLAKIRPAPNFDWLDKTWFDEMAATWLQKSIVDFPLVLVSTNDHLPPTKVIFPQADSADIRSSFRGLAEAFHGPVVPDAQAGEEWESIVSDWSLLSNLDNIGIQIETLASLSSRVSTCETVPNLVSALASRGTKISQGVFLNRLYDLLLRSGESRILEKIPLLPNQLGTFKRRNSLKRDDNLDDELKDSADSLGQQVRAELLDRGVEEQVQELLNPYGQENLIATLLKLSIAHAATQLGNANYRYANAKLFGWLARNRRAGEIKAFPIISARLDSSNTPQLADQRDQLLPPVGLWSSDLRAFADLFPDRNIFSDEYVSVLGAAESGWLEQNGFLIQEPLTKETKDLNSSDLENLLEKPFSTDEEEKEHLAKNIEVADLSFLTLKDRGILDVVRGSRSKGAKFLAFIFDYLLPRSAGAMEFIPVSCTCAKVHSIHRALWLPPIKERQWVNERRSHYGPPTAQNLARLWNEDPSLRRKLEDDSVLMFLSRIGVSASEILMNLAGGDDREMQRAFVSLLNAADNKPEQLLKLAEVLSSDPELIEEFEKRKQRRERTRLNQQLGAFVETIFKALFQRSEVKALGLRVERTGRGSDFAIEYDLVDDDREWLLSVESNKAKFLVELKATYEASVGMTHVQAQEAVAQQDWFALCVVQLPFGQPAEEALVRSVARFVPGIGERLTEQVDMVEDIQSRTLQTVSHAGEIEVVMQEGVVRYRVREQVWLEGMDFEGFVAHLVEKLGERRPNQAIFPPS
jgi:hypothetical protein